MMNPEPRAMVSRPGCGCGKGCSKKRCKNWSNGVGPNCGKGMLLPAELSWLSSLPRSLRAACWFNSTEMLTTAGNTCTASGARLGSATISAACGPRVRPLPPAAGSASAAARIGPSSKMAQAVPVQTARILPIFISRHATSNEMCRVAVLAPATSIGENAPRCKSSDGAKRCDAIDAAGASGACRDQIGRRRQPAAGQRGVDEAPMEHCLGACGKIPAISVRAPAAAAADWRRSRTLGVRFHYPLQLARSNLRCGDDAAVISLSLLVARSAQANHQPRHLG